MIGLAPPPAPSEAVIDLVRKLLVECEAGRVLGVAFATVNPGHECTEAWSMSADAEVFRMYAAIDVLKLRFGARFIEGFPGHEV